MPVTTRSGANSPALSRVTRTSSPPLRPRAPSEAAAALGPSHREQASLQRRGGAPPSLVTALRRAAFLALLCYLAWFVLILGGILAYEGEPILVKSRELPLHWFDRLFRTLGSLLLFALWGVRALWGRLFPLHFDRRWNLVFAPAAIYLLQAVVRIGIYQLHAAGWLFSPERYARDNQTHPPHVMSDHILLASAVHGGLACEALLPLLNWRHTEATGRGRAFLRAYCAAAGALAALVACESYFTARYFHPPGEILLAAALGLAMFQAPLLLYAVRAFQAHHQAHLAAPEPAAVAAAAGGGGGDDEAADTGARHRAD